MQAAMDSLSNNLETVSEVVSTTVQPAVIGLSIAIAVIVFGRSAIKKLLKF